MSRFDELRARMLMLARARLRERPRDLSIFEAEAETLPMSVQLGAVALAGDARVNLIEWADGYSAEQDAMLLRIVDEWAAKREPVPFPDPLASAVQPIAPAPAPATPMASSDAPACVPRVPLMQANRQRVLAALLAAGFDPLALPPWPKGKASPAKTAARAGAGLSPSTFERAWKELRAAKALRP